MGEVVWVDDPTHECCEHPYVGKFLPNLQRTAYGSHGRVELRRTNNSSIMAPTTFAGAHLTNRIAHHRKSIAQIDAMVQEAWDDYEEGGTPELWRKLKTAWRNVEKARAGHDTVGLREALDEVGRLIVRGDEQTQRMDRKVKLLDQRRKHANSELKRRQAEERTFTHEEAAAYYKGLGEAVRKHVGDRKIRRAILNDTAAIAGRADVDVPLAPEAKPTPEEAG